VPNAPPPPKQRPPTHSTHTSAACALHPVPTLRPSAPAAAPCSTCANYTAEIWGWTLFSIGTSTASAYLFTAAGAYQMAIWAKAKHRRLQKVGAGGAQRLCNLPQLGWRCAWGSRRHANRLPPPPTSLPRSKHHQPLRLPLPLPLQLFDGKDGREKYPKRWIMLPPFY